MPEAERECAITNFSVLVAENSELLKAQTYVCLKSLHLPLTDVDDILQEVMLRFLARARTHDNPDEVLFYLRGMIRNVARERRRDYLKRQASAELPDAIPAPVDDIDVLERTGHIKYCLAQLSDADQELFELRYCKNLTHVQIAEKLALETDAVSQRVKRAMDRLKVCCKRRLGLDF